MKFLLVGANGQVGRELHPRLVPLGDVVTATRVGKLHDGTPVETVDLSALSTLAALLERVRPDVIVNAAAYTAVDRAEDEETLATRINGEALAVIGRWAHAHDALVVHYSTDYVFDGRRGAPWAESDPVAPLGAYGRSKLAGERALAASGAAHLIFRTAWVYAAHGHNFLRTMLRLAGERDSLSVVDDQIGTPTSAALIADVTTRVLETWQQRARAERDRLSGIYHLVAEGQASWCDFARAIMAGAQEIGLIGHPPEVRAVGSDAFPTRAVRPAWSVLDTRHLRETFEVDLPPWQDGLTAVLEELAARA